MKKIFYIGIGMLLLAGCAHENKSGEAAKAAHAESLQEQEKEIVAVRDSCRDAAATLGDDINNLLRDFTTVNKTQEVSGYSIFQGWENRYPLKSTGVVARLAEGGEFELIAALSGGVFDQIRVEVEQESAQTNVVPNDQALNYRAAGLTTVMFSGPEALKVGELIMDNELNNLKVVYLQNGKPTGSWKMAHDNVKMISMTAMLGLKEQELHRVENRGMLMENKLQLIREHLHTGPASK
ncbi:MAG: hypothetical protein HDS79_04220 [Bacteroidales bacterium]|nr:hypothetical protein [Bacteroidales bacterium]MDE7466647.1 hypothetical protein [Muribaculaceae bacterium]